MKRNRRSVRTLIALSYVLSRRKGLKNERNRYDKKQNKREYDEGKG